MFRAGAILLMAAATAIQPIPRSSTEHPNQQPIQQTASAQQQPGTDERGTEHSPLVVKMSYTKEGDKQAAEDATYKAEDAFNNTLLMVFNGILATVAALELIYIVRQESWMRKSVNAADSAAKAATQSAKAAIAAQRPWLDIDIKPISDLTFDDDGPKITLAFQITNIGTTPATNVQFWAYLIPEPDSRKTNAFEEAFMLARAWAERMKQSDFGLFVSPGNAPQQEQTHTVERQWLDIFVQDWSERPPIRLIIAVAMTYRFVGGSGRTECGFRFQRIGAEGWTPVFYPERGPVDESYVTCERNTLWDSGD